MNRNTAIDLLKSIGILFIIIAHSNPPRWLFEFRSFDVPLLVFISAYTFNISSKDEELNINGYFNYIIKRFRRLIIPTWYFLVIYFVIFKLIDFFTNNKLIDFNFNEIMMSFLLLSGIGFVWIIRVYFLIALISPILKQFIRNYLSRYIMIFILLAINTLLYYKISIHNHFVELLVTEIVLYATGYGVIFVAGSFFYKESKINNLFNTIVLLLVSIIFFYVNKDFGVQYMKYPPRLIYIVYGILMSNLLGFLVETSFILNLSKNKFFYYCSKYSLDIYFIHIFPVQILNYRIIQISKTDFPFRFIFIFVVTAIISYFYIKRKITLFK